MLSNSRLFKGLNVNLKRFYSSLSLEFVPKHEPILEKDFELLRDFLEKHNRILVLTGAGISTESGVKPKKNKWSMEDCKFFEQLVLKKTFASTIKDIQNDELYKYDLVLSLELVDTSSDDDVRIDELLIQKGIAIREE